MHPPASATARRDGCLPVAAYAAIGDGHTAALVALDGAVDWLCLPRFDAPPTFGRLVDPARGGAFTLAPETPYTVTRRYVTDTNVLETTFRTPDGVARVVDAMTRTPRTAPGSELVRLVDGVDGDVSMAWRVAPQTGWTPSSPTWETRRRAAVARMPDGRSLAVQSWDAGGRPPADGSVAGRFTTAPGSRSVLALGAFSAAPILLPERGDVLARLEETIAFWRSWIAPMTFEGPHPDAVRRSALTLGLCQHQASGALVAAPTTSLPEQVGGSRNWDYRFCWLRDTSLALDAVVALGLRELDHTTLTWVLQATTSTHPRLAPCYTLDATTLGPERLVDAAGWRGSRPVRDGNRAGHQLQLGSWGDLLETVWRFVEAGNTLDPDSAVRIGELADHLAALWRNPDAGIWEIDDPLRHHTRSKVSAWTALRRARELHARGEITAGQPRRWAIVEQEIARWVHRHCWDERRRTFLAAGDGSGDLDAATLLLGRAGFAGRERMSGTIDAVRRELGAGGPLLWRTTGLRGREGAFLACSFWLVDALAGCGRRDEAEAVFEQALACANDVGLLAEEIDPADRSQLGNMPQALSHLSLIRAALALHTQPAVYEARA